MHARSLVPAVMLAFAGLAAAQNTAPAADGAPPAPAATKPAPDTATEPAAAGAAAPAASATAKAAPQPRCHKEFPLGSNIPKTVCETEPDPESDQMRNRALDDLKNKVVPGYRHIGT